jgi:hypothetical protein
MAGLALDVLNLLFIAVQVTIPHHLGTSVAIDTVKGVLAFCELGDGLVVIVKSIGGSIRARLEGNRPKIVVSAVVAGIALSVRDCSGQFVNLSGRCGVHATQVCVLSGRMTGRAARKMVQATTYLTGLGMQVAGEAVFPERLD